MFENIFNFVKRKHRKGQVHHCFVGHEIKSYQRKSRIKIEETRLG